ncbi:MAG: TIGR00282 family metallophosphoesterase [Spirochaetes bacterium]|nr:TIGR00282 family metallophosphoesterase [Spirochaetota bacterium]
MAKLLTILCLGDIIGEGGRSAIAAKLTALKAAYTVDFTIANGENAAGGFGITRDVANELFTVGIDAITSGNHIWKSKDVFAMIAEEKRLLRPFNYPEGAPGNGFTVFTVGEYKIGVLNLLGRTFMDPVDCPFRRGAHAVRLIQRETNIIIVDFHAEATAEKQALGYHLDGTVSAVVGTHTHVQTADEHILPKGTAYMSDLGMCGGEFSIIGMKKDPALKRFLTYLPHKFEVEREQPMINGCVIRIDADTGRAAGIERVLVRHGQ